MVYANDNVSMVKAFRNIPGVETLNVNRLSLKALAPGGQLGRFVIYTQSAIQTLDSLFGTARKTGELKKGHQMLKPVLANPDISRIINSNEVQSVVNPVKTDFVAHYKQKKNALKNKSHMNALNPLAEETRKAARLTNEKNQQARKDAVGKKRTVSKDAKKALNQRKTASK